MRFLVRNLGVTTVARWMTEQLPKGIDAYMACSGKLFRLKRLEVTNRSIRPVLESTTGLIGSEFTTEGVCTLESPVYLSREGSRERNLVGANAADVAAAAEVVGSNCWALRSTPEGDEVSPSPERETTASTSVATSDRWYG